MVQNDVVRNDKYVIKVLIQHGGGGERMYIIYIKTKKFIYIKIDNCYKVKSVTFSQKPYCHTCV